MRLRVCHIMEIREGQLAVFTVPPLIWPVLATRQRETLLLYPGVCPHEDVSLATATLEAGSIVCPGHGYRFRLPSGACAHRASLCLRRYRHEVINDEVWIWPTQA